jgi:hypothetical protein
MLSSRLLVPLLALLGWLLPAAPALAQTTGVDTRHQLWLGYMTQTRLSERYGWWNDAHLVPGSFYVLRTGLTYRWTERLHATLGYAYLGLALSSENRELKRPEHRPWGQMGYNQRFAQHWSFTARWRQDARFRRNVTNGQLAPGYGFANRSRLLVGLRRDFPELGLGEHAVPYATLGNEVLVEWTFSGARLDQNRVIVGIGLARRDVSLQLSYMNRYVQLAPGAASRGVMNHTLVLWLFQNFDLRPTKE